MEKYKTPLAESVYNSIKPINFGENRTLRPIVEKGILEELNKEKLFLDYRASPESKEGYKSVFEGLAFDESAVRTQSFSVYEGEQPIAIMSVAITPRSWIEKQRYVKRENGIITILDYRDITESNEAPDFYIIPAMTKVVESHRAKIAMPGFNAIKNIFEVLKNEAPANTYMEVIAQGKLERKKWNEVEQFLINNPIGTSFQDKDFLVDATLIGENSPGSSSTIKMARLLELIKAENIASGKSLGPVFIKKIK